MLFNSFEYLLFLPAVFCIYWFATGKSARRQNVVLLLSSYLFYGWWSYRFLGLLVLSTLLDFAYGFGVASPDRKKAKIFLWLSVINNLGILGIFKYYDFFALQLSGALHSLGIDANFQLLQVLLPVGISFYTFHGLSYVFDIYRGRQQPERSIINYATFVGFFPLLVAGPIERATHLLPQIRLRRSFSYSQASSGCRLILWGLFKKVVVADSLAGTVNGIFEHYHDKNAITLIVGAVAFSFQIYGDFSGYSDIAIGSSKLLGFEVLTNFRFPYFSRSVAEFWKRWHVSLSSWFRDYLYIPMGGSRKGRLRTLLNIIVVFLVSGLWHGAAWKYVIWGGIHALALLPLRIYGNRDKYTGAIIADSGAIPPFRQVFAVLKTFTQVTIAWVFFRADNVSSGLGYLRQIARSIWYHPGELILLHMHVNKFIFIYMLLLAAGDWYIRRNERDPIFFPNSRVLRMLLYCSMVIFILFRFNRGTAFIYFQF